MKKVHSHRNWNYRINFECEKRNLHWCLLMGSHSIRRKQFSRQHFVNWFTWNVSELDWNQPNAMVQCDCISKFVVIFEKEIKLNLCPLQVNDKLTNERKRKNNCVLTHCRMLLSYCAKIVWHNAICARFASRAPFSLIEYHSTYWPHHFAANAIVLWFLAEKKET